MGIIQKFIIFIYRPYVLENHLVLLYFLTSVEIFFSIEIKTKDIKYNYKE